MYHRENNVRPPPFHRSAHALAQKRFMQAAELDPTNATYAAHVAITHVSLGKLPLALRELNRFE
jgi:hypothetical protein